MVGRVIVVVLLLVLAGWIFYCMIYPHPETRRKMKMSEALISCRRVGHRLKVFRLGSTVCGEDGTTNGHIKR